jgi:hypothetical protein
MRAISVALVFVAIAAVAVGGALTPRGAQSSHSGPAQHLAARTGEVIIGTT